MHLVKQYISKYNKGKEEIKICLQNIEINLDTLLTIKNLKNVEDCKQFLEYVFNKKYELIDVNIGLVVELLNELQRFCHEDIKIVIPFIEALNGLEEQEAFKKAKDIDWLIETLKQETSLKEKDKKALLEISEFNKKVRYFIHSTLSFCQNPLPYQVAKELKTNIKKNEMLVSPDEMYEDICYCLSESNRIKKAVEKFHILSNVEYGHWETIDTTSEDIIKYLEIYKNRFEGYYYKNNLYSIEVIIKSKVKGTEKLSNPMLKIKEVIDVLLHNAAEELVEKEIEEKRSFLKKIKCTVLIEGNNIRLSISDNGRGLQEGDLDKAFVGTKHSINNYGIGLDVANKNVRVLNGKLTKYNNRDKGATFEFLFPMVRTVESEGFRQKVNILAYGNYKKLEETIKSLNEEYGDIRIVKYESLRALSDELNGGILNFINIIVKEKNKKDLNDYINEGRFKGKIIKV